MRVAAIALVAMGTPASAQDHAGSRDVPTSGKLKKKDVEKHGFRVTWIAGAPPVPGGPDGVDGAISSAVGTKGDTVIAADTSGYMYGLDKDDETVLWKTCIDPHGVGNDCSTSGGLGAGILGNPVVSGNMVYQGTLSGNMVTVNTGSGAIVWTRYQIACAGWWSVAGIWAGGSRGSGARLGTTCMRPPEGLGSMNSPERGSSQFGWM